MWVRDNCVGYFWCNGRSTRCGHRRAPSMECNCSATPSSAELLSRIGPSVMCPPPEQVLGPEALVRKLQPTPSTAATSMASGPWQRDEPSRFAALQATHHPGFPRVGCGASKGSPKTTRCADARSQTAFAHTLGHIWRPKAARGGRLIYLDLGANSPMSSIRPFGDLYPDGESFAVTAFEADPAWAPLYEQPCCRFHASCDVKLIRAGIGARMRANESMSLQWLSNDGHSIGRSVRAVPDAMHTVEIRSVSLVHWLTRHVRHEDWVVCKMDIENVEHQVLPELLAVPSTLRLIDELFVECHHRESYGVGPHYYSECLSMYERLMAEGVWVHDYF